MIHDIVRLVILAALLSFVAWQCWRAFRRSEERSKLVGKWVASALIFGFAFFVLGPHAKSGLVFIIVPMLAACGVFLGILWAPQLAALISRPLETLFLGNNSPDEKALYAIALAHCKRGRYQEAIEEIEGQLASFPHDAEGQLLLARIQAENLGNLPAAEETLWSLLAQEGHPPHIVAFALNQIADWRVSIGHDIEGAREALSRIQQLFPETELAYMASQRSAHLGPRQLEAMEPSKPLSLPPSQGNIGLRDDFTGLKPVEKSPAQTASELVQHLAQIPNDDEAREQLAIVYARQLDRMDLAVAQLELLLSQPGVPPRKMAHWHHLLADLYIQCAGDLEQARLSLQRLIDSSPRGIEAEKARSRLNLLALEFKAQQKSQAIKLGSYDQRLGLKHGPPKRPGT